MMFCNENSYIACKAIVRRCGQRSVRHIASCRNLGAVKSHGERSLSSLLSLMRITRPLRMMPSAEVCSHFLIVQFGKLPQLTVWNCQTFHYIHFTSYIDPTSFVFPGVLLLSYCHHQHSNETMNRGTNLSLGDIGRAEDRVVRIVNLHYEADCGDVQDFFGESYTINDFIRRVNLKTSKNTVGYVLFATE